MKIRTLILIVLPALALLGGCGDGDLGMTITEDDPNLINEEIRRIEENPHMPAQAKAVALGQLRSRQQAAPVTAEAAQKADKARESRGR